MNSGLLSSVSEHVVVFMSRILVDYYENAVPGLDAMERLPLPYQVRDSTAAPDVAQPCIVALCRLQAQAQLVAVPITDPYIIREAA